MSLAPAGVAGGGGPAGPAGVVEGDGPAGAVCDAVMSSAHQDHVVEVRGAWPRVSTGGCGGRRPAQQGSRSQGRARPPSRTVSARRWAGVVVRVARPMSIGTPKLSMSAACSTGSHRKVGSVAAGSGSPSRFWIDRAAARTLQGRRRHCSCRSGERRGWSGSLRPWGLGCWLGRRRALGDRPPRTRGPGGITQVRDAEFGERLVVALVLVEQLICDGVEGVVHAQGPFAGQFAAQQHDVVGR